MKGKSIIELRDVRTGEVERHVDHNLATNGMNVFPGTAVGGKTVLEGNQYFPLWQNWFSGIRLFENKLDEDPDNYIYKYAEPITGYASNTADTTDPQRGLFNISESGPLEDRSGIRLVWDFAQNQANGQISCISIVPNLFVLPERIDSMYYSLYKSSFQLPKLSDGTNITDRSIFVDYDKSTRITTFAVDARVKIKNGYIKLIRCLLEPMVYSVAAERSLSLIDEHDIEIPANTFTSEIAFFMTEKGNYYAMYCTGRTWDSSSKTYAYTNNLISINKKTFTPEIREFQYTADGSNAYPSLGVSTEKDGYLYVYTEGYNFKIDLASLENIIPLEKLTTPNIFSGDELLTQSYVWDANGNYQIKKGGDGFNLYIGSYFYPGGLTELMKGIYMAVSAYGSTYALLVVADTRIIYTINNLATPVIKTADKTMKITYILTNE